MAESTDKRLELENAHRFPMSELGQVFKRMCEFGFRGPEVLFLNNVYLPKPDDETSPRIRVQVAAADGATVILHSTKIKAHVPGGNGVKWEKETVIEQPRMTQLIAQARTGDVRLPGNYRLRLQYRAEKFEDLTEVNVYLDFVVTYDGRFIGPILEVEIMLNSADDVVPTIPKLKRLAERLLATVGEPMTESFRTLSERPPPPAVAQTAPAKEKKKKKEKKKEKKKKR